MNEKALFALKHMMGAAISRADRPLAGDDAQPWCELLERITRTMDDKIAYTVRPLLMFILDQHEKLTDEQKGFLGKASRRLLGYAWSRDSYDSSLVTHALQAICRTFESNFQESESLLRKTLEPDHLREHGYNELHWIAREIDRFIQHELAPELIRDIFIAAFTFSETSDDKTPMGGRILPMVSTRMQDFDMARYNLNEIYPAFLNKFPIEATKALIPAIEHYLVERERPLSEIIEGEFELKGKKARIRTDYSSIWDEGDAHGGEYARELLQAFDKYLRSISVENNKQELRQGVINTIIDNNILACVWRRIIDCAKDHPQTLGLELRELAWSHSILACYDTSSNAGELIRSIFPFLDVSERERIENAITSIPDRLEPEAREAGEYIRDRLLGCLDQGQLITRSAKERLEELDKSEKGVPPNRPPVRFGGVSWEPYSELDRLKDDGIDVEADQNKRLLELREPLKEFGSTHLNTAPTLDQIKEIFPRMQEVHSELKQCTDINVDQRVRENLFAYLVEACKCAAMSDELTCEREIGQFIKDVLLEASKHHLPNYNAEMERQFDEVEGWGSPSPRIDSAEGLISLANHPTCAEKEILNAIESLGRDPVSSVRYQIACRLILLYKTAPDLMWKLIEQFSKEEQNSGVMNGLVVHTMHRIARPDTDRAFPLINEIFRKTLLRDTKGAKNARENFLTIFTNLFLWQDHEPSKVIVFEIINDPAKHSFEAMVLPSHLRNFIELPETPTDQRVGDARTRSFELLASLAKKTKEALFQIDEEHKGKPVGEWPESVQEQTKALLQILDAISNTIFFASGAYGEKERQRKGETSSLQTEAKKRFFADADHVISELAEAGHPAIIHHLVETLEFLMEVNPEKVLLRLGQIIKAGRPGGYQYESLAADLIVKIVERLLAEFRHVLRASDECRLTLFEILDTFVEVGWPRARRLVYRLEDIYR